MSTTIPTTTDDLIADLERLTSDSELTDEQWISGFTAGDFRALLSERADLKQQLVAAGITADNCEMFRKDAERYQFLRRPETNPDFLCRRDKYKKYFFEFTLCGAGLDYAIDAAMRQ